MKPSRCGDAQRAKRTSRVKDEADPLGGGQGVAIGYVLHGCGTVGAARGAGARVDVDVDLDRLRPDTFRAFRVWRDVATSYPRTY